MNVFLSFAYYSTIKVLRIWYEIEFLKSGFYFYFIIYIYHNAIWDF